jgi:hypothetical protein
MHERVADTELFTKMIDECARRFCHGYQSNRERNLTVQLYRQMPPSTIDNINSSKPDGDKALTTIGGEDDTVNAQTRHRAGRRQKARGSGGGGGRTLTQGALIEYIREQEIWAHEARARDCTGTRMPFANVNTYKFVVDVMLAGLAKCMRRVGIDCASLADVTQDTATTGTKQQQQQASTNNQKQALMVRNEIIFWLLES